MLPLLLPLLHITLGDYGMRKTQNFFTTAPLARKIKNWLSVMPGYNEKQLKKSF
jgi:hypothetical protein